MSRNMYYNMPRCYNKTLISLMTDLLGYSHGTMSNKNLRILCKKRL
jgi:hypothetical protein